MTRAGVAALGQRDDIYILSTAHEWSPRQRADRARWIRHRMAVINQLLQRAGLTDSQFYGLCDEFAELDHELSLTGPAEMQ